MADIALSAKNHDVIFVDGDILFIANAERVAQDVKIKLLTFYGEWFLNVEHGVPYFEYILDKDPNLLLIRQIFREKILEVDDVNGVDELDLDYDVRNRTLEVSFSVTTNFGLVTDKEVLNYGTF